jgi:hypothetical protein
VVVGAGGVVGGSVVGSGVANRTFFFGGGMVAFFTLRIECKVGCGADAGTGVSNTLRGGSLGGGEGGKLGTVLSWLVVVQMPVSKSVRFCNAVTWLSVKGAREAVGDGWFRAVVISVRAARIRSLEEASGMVIFVGNHETVSDMRSARVSSIQIV